MKRETIIWFLVMLIGAAALIINAYLRHAGSAYVKAVPKQFVDVAEPHDFEPDWVNYNSEDALDEELCQQSFESIPAEKRVSWMSYEQATLGEHLTAQRDAPDRNPYQFSLPRTIGVLIAALFTLFIFSFLYKDNPLYKFAEAIIVGVSAAYWMVVAFWEVIVPNLIGKLAPELVRRWAMPGLEDHANYWYLAPLILGVMLLWRLSPKGAWIGRWPLAFIIGTTAGIRILGYIEADFLSQVHNTLVSLAAINPDTGDFSIWDSLKNLIIIIGVLSALVYFFFSIEHKGIVGKTARLGIWFLMVTFGAAFGYTVMGRIALLAIRIEYLVDDWLWLIDPTGKRMLEEAVTFVPGILSALGVG